MRLVRSRLALALARAATPLCAAAAAAFGALLLAAAVSASPAAAQVLPQLTPPPTTSRQQAPPAPPQAPPAPTSGRAAIHVVGGLVSRGVRYVYSGQLVTVVGSVFPYVPRQAVVIDVVRSGRVVRRVSAAIGRGAGGRGRFSASFRLGHSGAVRVVATHRANSGQAAFRSNVARFRVVGWSAGLGARGTRVRVLQLQLRRLGYVAPLSGSYGAGTARAVLAFRKVNFMSRIGYASRSVYAKLFRGRGAFRLKYPRAGRHVEFDWSRQVLVLADHGRPHATYHASSGKPSTPTVFGTYRFYSKTPGVNSHGMVDSNYFIGGYAVHGYPSVPTYPASHGCIRVPIPNASGIYRWIHIGTRIFIYR